MKQMKTANMVSSNSNWNHLLILYTAVLYVVIKWQTKFVARVTEVLSCNMSLSQSSRGNLTFGIISLQKTKQFIWCKFGLTITSS